MHDCADRSVTLGALKERLSRWESLGLARPAAASVRQYCDVLADEGVLTRKTATNFASLYDACRFGKSTEPLAPANEIFATLDDAIAEVESWDEHQRTALRDRFLQRWAPAQTPEAPVVEKCLPPAPEPAPSSSLLPENIDVTNEVVRRKRLAEQGPSRLWPAVAGGLVLWTVLVMAGSLWQQERLEQWLVGSSWGRPVYSRLRGEDGEIIRLRQKLKADDDPAALENARVLAERLTTQKRYAEAIYAYERAIQRVGYDTDKQALLQNNLAWVLLTAEDSWYRDPPRAKTLTEHALKLAPDKPDYLDTHAEALFQLGDLEGALAESTRAKDIATMTGTHHSWYTQQWMRFHQAVERAKSKRPREAPLTGMTSITR
jgi:tetratricopeptide (TPR) repeat protein